MALIERYPFTRILLLAGLAAATAAGQSYHFDNSGNATLKGQYFVREVVLRNVSAQGSIGEALSVLGIATFDGAGNYTFSGQLADSTSKEGPGSASSSGTYQGGHKLVDIRTFWGARGIGPAAVPMSVYQ